ncbi:stress responsive A/B barrel domain-containing protein [Jimgerdemannia flammicorona]|uniref:Stress responsive A/B barrel domain-containing protein n=1 Tax=Jimgerdemannia flammicorona TaxID=994334 RepID=A0A433QZM3_9FUNG|nr:stress responsive A/B barrel domain-containing protein [Jimgerdemannia flammicorona]
MTITHTVVFRFNIESTDVQAVIKQFHNLKNVCVRQGREYIQSIESGVNISEEGLDRGFTYVFIVKFDNKSDLDYYVNDDIEHKNFKLAVDPVLIKGEHDNGALVFDFECIERK